MFNIHISHTITRDKDTPMKIWLSTLPGNKPLLIWSSILGKSDLISEVNLIARWPHYRGDRQDIQMRRRDTKGSVHAVLNPRFKTGIDVLSRALILSEQDTSPVYQRQADGGWLPAPVARADLSSPGVSPFSGRTCTTTERSVNASVQAGAVCHANVSMADPLGELWRRKYPQQFEVEKQWRGWTVVYVRVVTSSVWVKLLTISITWLQANNLLVDDFIGWA